MIAINWTNDAIKGAWPRDNPKNKGTRRSNTRQKETKLAKDESRGNKVIPAKANPELEATDLCSSSHG